MRYSASNAAVDVDTMFELILLELPIDNPYVKFPVADILFEVILLFEPVLIAYVVVVDIPVDVTMFESILVYEPAIIPALLFPVTCQSERSPPVRFCECNTGGMLVCGLGALA